MIMNKWICSFALLIILSSGSLSAMEQAKSGYPKWDGLVELKKAGLPTPDGMFVWPHSSEAKIREIVNLFVSQSRTELIALRPDGINGIGKTPPGINFKKTDLVRIISKLIEWSTKVTALH